MTSDTCLALTCTPVLRSEFVNRILKVAMGTQLYYYNSELTPAERMFCDIRMTVDGRVDAEISDRAGAFNACLRRLVLLAPNVGLIGSEYGEDHIEHLGALSNL